MWKFRYSSNRREEIRLKLALSNTHRCIKYLCFFFSLLKSSNILYLFLSWPIANKRRCCEALFLDAAQKSKQKQFLFCFENDKKAVKFSFILWLIYGILWEHAVLFCCFVRRQNAFRWSRVMDSSRADSIKILNTQWIGFEPFAYHCESNWLLITRTQESNAPW